MEHFFTLEIIFRFFLATILGAIIGSERSFFKKQAGVRTFALVSLSAALFSYLGVSIDDVSKSRVLSNIVVGVGFLGAGVIFLSEQKIVGLTTAAALWITTAIGASVGLGFYIEAIFSTILSLIILLGFYKIEYFIRKESEHIQNNE
jgi:putative Mg2+ transporter-C (MgtC) family protein